ncbi:MAG: 30S ribosomal protein S12 methylthiotransferase RimO [Lachnospiraceae bacterium]|nr:30S ribosomal protein S12 methylthiotransferase RimO [Lachnospiraceae bacterium]MEE1342727.1 30S ribosomal protein S12 methylthiotransferase RimO [Lachnospiraceae bacterium]
MEKKILFISLGCDKNLVDSEVMLGLLAEHGFIITNEEEEADAIVVNTCCFIHDAKEESITTILEMAKLKETGKLKALIVTGCLAQRYKEEILTEIEEVDAVLGSKSYDQIVETVNKALEGEKVQVYNDLGYMPKVEGERLVSTGSYYAYLKIAEGCDKRCTYCIIPSIRGQYQSVPMEQIIEEATRLAKQGVKELILVAQETTVYGIDLYKEKRLPKLLKELAKIQDIEWIRLLYCYPEEITKELIQVMKEEEKICHYIDMPIQHSEDDVLKRMGRKTNHQELKEIIGLLRKEIPDICIRTTLISGFPGETLDHHEALLDFVDEMEFDRLGVFPYSQEEDTVAAQFEDQIEEEEKQRRRNEIMELQQAIVFEQNERMVGKEITVLIEGYLYEEDIYIGRTYKDAPNVDGTVFVQSEEELISGDFVTVKITNAKEYDLIGGVVYESAK